MHRDRGRALRNFGLLPPAEERVIEDRQFGRDYCGDRSGRANAAQKQIMSDAPWVFLYQPDFVLAMRKNVHGYVYYSADRFTRFKFLSKTAS